LDGFFADRTLHNYLARFAEEDLATLAGGGVAGAAGAAAGFSAAGFASAAGLAASVDFPSLDLAAAAAAGLADSLSLLARSLYESER
jgi:hypothetical protein